MRTKLIAALGLAIGLAFAAAPASAQGIDLYQRAPNVDSARMDGSVKSYQDAVKYYQAGQIKQAERELEKLLGRVGEHAGGNFLMGMVRIQQQDFEKARTSFRNAVKFDPTMISPHGWLGAVEAVLGNKEGALEQKAELEKMKAACANACPKAADIDLEIKRIDDNLAPPPAN